MEAEKVTADHLIHFESQTNIDRQRIIVDFLQKHLFRLVSSDTTRAESIQALAAALSSATESLMFLESRIEDTLTMEPEGEE